MRKKMIYILPIILIILLIVYWFYFVREYKVLNSKFLSVCKIDSPTNHIRINLMESSKYISSIKQRSEQNILYIEVYTTSIFNFFAKNNKAFIELKNDDNIKSILILNKQYVIDSIPLCK
jgi:hypothetical protein